MQTASLLCSEHGGRFLFRTGLVFGSLANKLSSNDGLPFHVCGPCSSGVHQFSDGHYCGHSCDCKCHKEPVNGDEVQ